METTSHRYLFASHLWQIVIPNRNILVLHQSISVHKLYTVFVSDMGVHIAQNHDGAVFQHIGPLSLVASRNCNLKLIFC
jgi:hypothetical protein